MEITRKKIVIFRRPIRVGKAMAEVFNNDPNYHARAATSYQDCLGVAEQFQPDLLIVDQNLEKKHEDESAEEDKKKVGAELIAAAKAKLPTIKAILISKEKVKSQADFLVLSKFQPDDIKKLVRVIFHL